MKNRLYNSNNRTVINEFGVVRQVTNYYPFGGVFSTTAYNSGDDLQPYKYNGKELDRTHGLDWYDYGARNYDATLPMWDRVDPLCEEFYHITPYAYCYNNPVNVVDPDGRIGHIVVAIGIGAGIGAGVEILSQVTSNAIKNGGLSAECFTEINWPDVGYAAAAGAISGSASALGGKIATSVATRTGSNITGKVFGKVAEEGTEFVADVVGNIGDEEVLKSAAKDYAKGKFVGKFVDKKLAQPYINSSAAVKAAKSRAANAGKKLTQKEINKVVRENKAAQKSATKNKSIERSNKAKEIAVDYLWNTAKKLFNF